MKAWGFLYFSASYGQIIIPTIINNLYQPSISKNEKRVYDNFSDFSLYIKHERREEGLSSDDD